MMGEYILLLFSLEEFVKSSIIGIIYSLNIRYNLAVRLRVFIVTRFLAIDNYTNIYRTILLCILFIVVKFYNIKISLLSVASNSVALITFTMVYNHQDCV